MNTHEIKNYVVQLIASSVVTESDTRLSNLLEFLSVVAPQENKEGPLTRWCQRIPSLLPELYERWASQFAERMLETIPQNQLELLCNGEQENDAALKLAFVMFMESERMEKQVIQDLTSGAFKSNTEEDQLLLDTLAQALSSRLRQQ